MPQYKNIFFRIMRLSRQWHYIHQSNDTSGFHYNHYRSAETEGHYMHFFKPMLVLLLLSGVFAASNPPKIKKIWQTTGFGIDDNQDSSVVIRTVLLPDTAYLVVDPDSLSVSLQTSGTFRFKPATWSDLRKRFAATAYFRALAFAADSVDPVGETGLGRLCTGVENGVELTFDLCPSYRPLDKEIFTRIIENHDRAARPVPVGIAITGKWIERHPEEFCWLDSLVRDSLLSIVWINHTFNHRAHRFLPRHENFFLEKGAKVSAEILGVEEILIEWGCMPSVFFRFPGLVADSTVYDSVLAYGLIPLSSDAWLAKGEHPAEGSIILVHANGNEPRGVKNVLAMIDDARHEQTGRQWKILDLRRGVIDIWKPSYNENTDTTEWWRSAPAGGQVGQNGNIPASAAW
jgi:hypothetical protein